MNEKPRQIIALKQRNKESLRRYTKESEKQKYAENREAGNKGRTPARTKRKLVKKRQTNK